ncbi:DUF805 domain-containing protein [Deinococcus sp.]|uniref:DUF805 domain-containing protein n=1 Tax=Deinococcus sp. TaxID=47478 RepID=UPI0025C6C81B|nr:DUF805 domain-containing protein [Deinococcus sp.]
MNEYLNVIRNHYADFKGRARRREYWLFALINWAISMALSLPYLLTSGSVDPDSGMPAAPSGLPMISIGLAGLYSLATLVPSLAVTVRRLHDTGRSGWGLLVSLVPLVGSLVMLVLTILDSQPGSNKWGPNPKAMEASAATTW